MNKSIFTYEEMKNILMKDLPKQVMFKELKCGQRWISLDKSKIFEILDVQPVRGIVLFLKNNDLFWNYKEIMFIDDFILSFIYIKNQDKIEKGK